MRFLRLNAFAVRLAQIVVLGLAFTTGLLADTITLGEPADGLNAFPFGGKDTVFSGTRYQQAYASTAFGSPGPILITSISFLNGNGGTFATSEYDFSLSTITAGIDALSALNFDGNRGPDNTLFASPMLSGPSPITLTITGLAPFLYDPAQGNLLMDIVVSPGGVTPAAFSAGYSSRQGTANGIFSRYHNFGFATIGFGLVTRFEFTPVSQSVPEPSAFVLLSTGFLGIACSRLRRH
jgi:hypothetical protein